jgi:hypothetical protein
VLLGDTDQTLQTLDALRELPLRLRWMTLPPGFKQNGLK